MSLALIGYIPLTEQIESYNDKYQAIDGQRCKGMRYSRYLGQGVTSSKSHADILGQTTQGGNRPDISSEKVLWYLGNPAAFEATRYAAREAYEMSGLKPEAIKIGVPLTVKFMHRGEGENLRTFSAFKPL